ncbi:MAG: HAD-IA family hydrolase [Alphaproteobacteria bacterium]|nr:HAD-IA family hydrolase [Alphaproteobacteria bacterium]
MSRAGCDTLLFDLDGTLTDTDALHIAAYRRILARDGRWLSAADYKARVMGATNAAIMGWMFPGLDEAEHAALADEKERLFRSMVGRLRPLPGLTALLEWAAGLALRTAVVTNAPRDNAELMLGGLGLATRFPVLVIGDELARGKPDPLPYATALERLGSTADRAFAFEDSCSGVRAAAAAGIETFGLLTGLDEPTLRAAGAAAVIDDFADPRLLAKLEAEFGSRPA